MISFLFLALVFWATSFFLEAQEDIDKDLFYRAAIFFVLFSIALAFVN